MSTGSVHPQGRYRRGLMFPDDVELAHDRPALDGAAPNLSILEPTGNVAPLDDTGFDPAILSSHLAAGVAGCCRCGNHFSS